MSVTVGKVSFQKVGRVRFELCKDSCLDKLLELRAVSSFILTTFTLLVSQTKENNSCVFVYIFRDVNTEAKVWALVKNRKKISHHKLLSDLESYCKDTIHVSVFVLILYLCTRYCTFMTTCIEKY